MMSFDEKRIFEEKIDTIRKQYRRGMRTREEAVAGFAQVYAETLGTFSAIYYEMILCDFEECF